MPLPPDISPELSEKYQNLLFQLKELGSVLVSFSGGADSTLLLAACLEALGKKAQPVIFTGAFTPQWEVEAARKVAQQLDVSLWESDAYELLCDDISNNPKDRCYYCKRLRLEKLLELAKENGLAYVVEGSQADDIYEDRPGARALAELKGLSPLAKAGIGKQDIRDLGKALGLYTAQAPSGACLASRVPWPNKITQEVLNRIAKAEGQIRSILPDGQIRVRDHYPLARLELDLDLMAQVVHDPKLSQIYRAVLEAGYQYATLDLKGYRNGGANQT